MVHLDVKPDNVVMGAPPRLIDLSVARSVEAAGRAAAAGRHRRLHGARAVRRRVRTGRPAGRRVRPRRHAAPRRAGGARSRATATSASRSSSASRRRCPRAFRASSAELLRAGWRGARRCGRRRPSSRPGWSRWWPACRGRARAAAVAPASHAAGGEWQPGGVRRVWRPRTGGTVRKPRAPPPEGPRGARRAVDVRRRTARWRVLHAALAFLPFAAFLAVLPGPATAMVIQSAARGGRARAMRATLGDAAAWRCGRSRRCSACPRCSSPPRSRSPRSRSSARWS